MDMWEPYLAATRAALEWLDEELTGGPSSVQEHASTRRMAHHAPPPRTQPLGEPAPVRERESAHRRCMAPPGYQNTTYSTTVTSTTATPPILAPRLPVRSMAGAAGIGAGTARGRHSVTTVMNSASTTPVIIM